VNKDKSWWLIADRHAYRTFIPKHVNQTGEDTTPEKYRSAIEISRENRRGHGRSIVDKIDFSNLPLATPELKSTWTTGPRIIGIIVILDLMHFVCHLASHLQRMFWKRTLPNGPHNRLAMKRSGIASPS
jgi:hypothetical protein